MTYVEQKVSSKWVNWSMIVSLKRGKVCEAVAFSVPTRNLPERCALATSSI